MNGIGVLKELYDSEINFSISCDSDGGFDVRLGDEYNGWKESKNFRDLDVGVRWLINLIRKDVMTSGIRLYSSRTTIRVSLSALSPMNWECLRCPSGVYSPSKTALIH
jgi:hypothetical protein